MTLRDLWLRIRALAAPRTVDRELDEELAFHLEMETRKLIASGQTPAGARALARARFGPASAADACRDAQGHRIHRQRTAGPALRDSNVPAQANGHDHYRRHHCAGARPLDGRLHDLQCAGIPS
jgi:hypothetical protein